MGRLVDWIDGWEIYLQADGGYGIYDAHGLVAGPFGTEFAAFNAAMRLPKPRRPAHDEAGVGIWSV
jgi:hypothetical protein